MHDALGEAQAEVTVVDSAGHALGSVHLVKGHLWVLVEPEKRKTFVGTFLSTKIAPTVRRCGQVRISDSLYEWSKDWN